MEDKSNSATFGATSGSESCTSTDPEEPYEVEGGGGPYESEGGGIESGGPYELEGGGPYESEGGGLESGGP